jgi:prepilin peptidase CpaA
MIDHPDVSTIAVTVLVLLAVIWDIRQHRIPNLLTFGAALLGLLLHSLAAGLDGFWTGLGGLGVGFAFLLPGYLLGFTGAGDVKLMAAAGSYLGPLPALYAAAASVVAGGVLALVYLALVPALRNGASPWARYWAMMQMLWVTGRPSYVSPAADEVAGRRFPYAVAIAAGTLGVLAWEMVAI